MSQMIEINLRPDAATLRQFGWIACVAFALLASFAWFEILIFSLGMGAAKMPLIYAFLALSGLSALFSLVYPQANLPIYVGLTLLAYPIGFVLSYVIMGTLFFGLIGPVAIFFRLIGRDAMERRYDPAAASYWSDSRPTRPASDYFRQF